MIIQKLHIENFRAFTSLDVEFSAHFNIIVGDNMSGKTAILEALNVAIGSFLLGIDGVYRVHIQKENIRLMSFDKSIEPQLPVIVEAEGIVDNQCVSWKRELTGENNRTKYIDAKEIKAIATSLQKRVRKGTDVLLPLIAYFPIDSIWKDNNLNVTDLYEKTSRIAGYENSLNATYNYRNFALWFKSIQLSNLQSGKFETELKVINNAVTNCIENCTEIYFDFAFREVVMRLTDGRIIPFTQLSSGFKKMMAIITDLAFRCIILNPYLGEAVLNHISGVVLIDEIDAHLHPSWQRKIVPRLKSTFPKLQFIVTTHSPHVVASADENEVIALPKLSERMHIRPIEASFKGWQLDYILKDILESTESVNEIDVNPILDKLDAAFEEENLLLYEGFLSKLESLLHPNDPILVVYKMKKSRFPIAI